MTKAFRVVFTKAGQKIEELGGGHCDMAFVFFWHFLLLKLELYDLSFISNTHIFLFVPLLSLFFWIPFFACYLSADGSFHC